MNNKETKQAGIYAITCVPTSKRFIGTSLDLENLSKDPFVELATKTHSNSILQQVYNTIGGEYLKFSIIEVVEPELLPEREYYWIKELKTTNSLYGYNISSPINFKKRTSSHIVESKPKFNSKRNVKKYLKANPILKEKLLEIKKVIHNL